MENKLREKRAIIEVMENMLSGIGWTLDSKKNEIEEYQRRIQQEKDDGMEVSKDDWRYAQIASAQAYLDAYEIVTKHLEKLI